MDKRSLLRNVDGFFDEEKLDKSRERPTLQHPPQVLLYCILTLSVLLNCFLGLGYGREGSQCTRNEPSFYAGLTRNREEPYVKETLYTSTNETLQAAMWHNINVDAGLVALPDSWVSSHELRRAQRFPWDHSKGLYLLHGYHNLHCVKIIYNSLHEHRNSLPQTRNWHHVVHCLDAMRRQVLCDADDTPRATERRAEVVTGVGQHRMCRSWQALDGFAQQHTACYQRPENPEDGVPLIERFKHCPPGSGYVVDNNYVPVDELLHGLPEESQLDAVDNI